MRLREQFDLTWDRLNIERRIIHVPADQAKGRRLHDVVTFEPAIIALRALPRHIKSRRVFWHRDGARFRHLDRGFKAVAKRAGIKDVRWHDLHRTHGCPLHPGAWLVTGDGAGPVWSPQHRDGAEGLCLP